VRDVGFAPLDAAARFGASAAPGRSCLVAAGLRLAVGADRLVLRAGPGAPPDQDGPLLDGEGRLADGWRLEVDSLPAGAWRQADVLSPSAWEAYADADRVLGPLAVRPRRPGERFQPLGLGGHSDKVSDHMINARLPAALRDRWPLVVCGDLVVWLPGLRLDERFKVSAATQTVLRLRFTRTAR
jgi:tRNA(Ile)-lysidine synthase